MKPSLICFKIPSLTQFIYKQFRGNPTTNDQYNLFYYLGPKKNVKGSWNKILISSNMWPGTKVLPWTLHSTISSLTNCSLLNCDWKIRSILICSQLNFSLLNCSLLNCYWLNGSILKCSLLNCPLLNCSLLTCTKIYWTLLNCIISNINTIKWQFWVLGLVICDSALIFLHL